MLKTVRRHFVQCNFNRSKFQYIAFSTFCNFEQTNVDYLILIRFLIIVFRFHFHVFLKRNMLTFTQFLIFYPSFDVFSIKYP